ncbi:C40 family peptidase [Paenibacillus sp. GCM10027627]|uniref:C40 family peptidase n=1 Tax=unclassified Paenibacillus TaxID=185978 RepID=UPI0036273849
MKFNTITKTAIALACILTLLSGQALAGTHYIGKAEAATATDSAAAAAPAKSLSKADAVINNALALRGKVTYKFGVNNPSRLIFDCSSFTKYVFGKSGVNLKWGTASQKNQGKYVSKSNLRKGDLIFFNNGKSSKISHVGIYMGNGQFVHNTIGSKVNGVIVSKLSEYTKRYSTARRVL